MYLTERVDGQRCIVCNHVIVDAWVCDECAWLSVGDDDVTGPSPTSVSRGRQRLVDQGAAFLLWLDLCGVIDSGITPVDSHGAHSIHRGPGDTTRSAAIRRRLNDASNRGMGRPEPCWAPPVRFNARPQKLADRRAGRRARAQEAA